MTEVRVIGAGLSGLCAAWYLAESGARVAVHEASGRPGGLLRTCQTNDGLVETAARAFTTTERVSALFTTTGVETCATLASSRKRFIFREGRPRRWPLSAAETTGAAARAAAAWMRRQTSPRDGESVADWGHRVVGTPATSWVIAPALQGIYAVAPEELSAQAIFGRGRAPGGRGPLVAPRGGMGALVEKMRSDLEARGVTFTFGAAVDRVDAGERTIICTNAASAARLVAPHAASLAAAISRIRTVSLLVVTAFFTPDDGDWHGFGVLFPRASGVRALGVLCNTDMFPGRSRVRSETWIYGDRSAAMLPSDAESLATLVADRAVITRRRDTPIATHVTRFQDALPVYDDAVLEGQSKLDTLPPSIAIAGNFLGRLGVSKLVDGAYDAAQRVLAARG